MPKDKKTIRKANKGERIAQVAAIPFRVNGDGELEVMLVTSRGTHRFIVPKGWPMKGKSARQAALIEAREEAGVIGKALKRPAGSYCYWKRLSTSFVHVEVTAFLIEVTDEIEDWQEAGARQRAWLRPADAAILIDEPELSTLIRNLKLADIAQHVDAAA
ncbi:NUDIX hydrolase [Aminobacter sp. HY435]|uniref:NUDIX hydrolase n=1 Tax=Aminobacter sp. HY435 TaxID=2970917 RepID=UPI0022B99B52|nr:NUDIX hydrolase [Aminobacter sp. HY435]